MLGEIYIATALAIFLAIFGWSEKLFGLSNKHIQSILSFCEKANLRYKNYLELMRLISQDKTIHAGIFQKRLINILSKSNIKPEDKPIMRILKDNSKSLGELNNKNKYKKNFFVVLFLFLFIGGSILFYLESEKAYVLESMIITQSILLIIIAFGTKIYSNIINIESKIQNNLNSLTTQMGDKKSGR
jgi:hypothetical protein